MTKRDVQSRIKRFQQLKAGFGTELTALSINSEPMNEAEHRGYRETLERMSNMAECAVLALQTTWYRLEREEAKASGK